MNATVAWFKNIEKWSMPKVFRLTSRLPEGWSLEFIGNLVSQVTEKVRVEEDKEYGLVGVKWYSEGTFHRETVRGSEISATYLTPVISNAFIYNRLFAWKQSFAIVPTEHDGLFVSNEFPQFIVDRSRLLPEFLYLIFRLQKTIHIVLSTSVGSAAVSRNRFKEEEFLKFEIPLPPLDIQRSIVARWHTAQGSAREADEKVIQIEADAEAQFFADLGTMPPKPVERPRTLTVNYSQLEQWGVRQVTDKLLGLDRSPESKFPIALLGDYSTVSYGIQKSPANRPGQHARPYLRVANVRKGYLDLREIKEINVPDAEMDYYRLEPGDILFVEGNGSRAELGRVGIWKGEIENCIHQNHLIKVRVNPERLNPEYVMTWFNTELGRGHFFRSAKTSSGLGTINSREVREAPIPIPPLDVQQAILKKVHAFRAEIARQRERAAQLRQQADAEVEAMILGTKKV